MVGSDQRGVEPGAVGVPVRVGAAALRARARAGRARPAGPRLSLPDLPEASDDGRRHQAHHTDHAREPEQGGPGAPHARTLLLRRLCHSRSLDAQAQTEKAAVAEAVRAEANGDSSKDK